MRLGNKNRLNNTLIAGALHGGQRNGAEYKRVDGECVHIFHCDIPVRST